MCTVTRVSNYVVDCMPTPRHNLIGGRVKVTINAVDSSAPALNCAAVAEVQDPGQSHHIASPQGGVVSEIMTSSVTQRAQRNAVH